jgi:hypothetical protein
MAIAYPVRMNQQVEAHVMIVIFFVHGEYPSCILYTNFHHSSGPPL